jgi:hypothetical protein
MKSPISKAMCRIAGTGVWTVFLLVLASCSGGPPNILSLEWTIESHPFSGGTYESLSLFVNVRDPDGPEDLESLWILDDETEYCWTLDTSTWTRKSDGADTWIGASDLILPGRQSLPRDRYRVLVSDLSGGRASSDFRIEAGSDAKPIPTIAVEEGVAIVGSEWGENYLVGYDAAGAFIRASRIAGNRQSITEALGSADAARSAAIAVYGYDATSRRGGFSLRAKAR